MSVIRFPVIDPVATGANICRLRKDRGLTVRDLQHYFGATGHLQMAAGAEPAQCR